MTAKAGLRFKHDPGAKGLYLMPEQMGSGAALFDFNNDGLLDIYLVQCGGTNSNSPNQLWRQEKDHTFTNASEGSGVDVTGLGMGVATGDLNNDGWTDLALTEYGRTRLFLNGGGKFTEITESAGIDNPRWGTAVSFVDYNRDGWLDLAVGNYLDYNPTEKCHDAAGALEYCGPQSFPSTASRLFRNRGGKDSLPRFDDVTVESGFATSSGAALGIFCADFTGDHWPDIFIADDGRPNRLFVNQQNGTFLEEAAIRGLAYTGMGATAANMGVAAGDVNSDGLFDLFVTHLITEQHTLWVQKSPGHFQDETAAFGLVNPEWKATGFGAALCDLDLDGALDLAFVNGAVRRAKGSAPLIEGLDPFWAPYAQRNQIFMGTPGGKFLEVSLSNADFSGRAGMGRALAAGDVDQDGDSDLLVTNTGGPVQLFENVAERNGNWLSVRAIDPALGNRDALGAEIILHAGGRKRWRLIQSSHSYLSASEPVAHFGVGPVERYERVEVIWPDGAREFFPGATVNRRLTIERGAGHEK